MSNDQQSVHSTCETCYWWDELQEWIHDRRTKERRLEPSGRGYCKRYPPQPIGTTPADLFFRHPKTSIDDYCGEHQPTAGGR